MIALREIRILQHLQHENVVSLLEICRSQASKTTFYLVFEYLDHDLAGLLANANVRLSLAEIKTVMKQILEGLYFIHINKVTSTHKRFLLLSNKMCCTFSPDPAP